MRLEKFAQPNITIFSFFSFFLLQKLISGEEHGAFIMLAQKGVLLISPLPNNPKFFSCKSSFHGQVIQADSPKFEECKLHSKRRNLGVWRDGRGQKNEGKWRSNG